MNRTIFCQKMQKELAGLDSPPFPGEIGQKIFDHISKQAWNEWLDQQVMLINEYHLSLFDEKSQKFLNEKMNEFLFQGKTITVDNFSKLQ